MWNILAVIPWAGAFHRNVTEDSINDRRDIAFSKRCVVSFFRIIFAISIVMWITAAARWHFAHGWIGTSIFLLRGSPGGKGCLFLGTARGSSFYIARWLLAAALVCSFYTACWLDGNWRRWANAHVLLSSLFLCSWHIPPLLPNSKKFTVVVTGWIHLCLFPTESTR